jgi:RNA polymerase I-specific transcription initiation factor RRN6
MAESLSDQTYGHFGQPVYHVQTKSWIFGRSSINSPRLEPLGEISQTIAGTKLLQEEASTLRKEAERQDKRYDRALNQEIRRVARGHPELQAAEHLLGPLIRGSEAVIAAVARYDPAIGGLLAFGTAVVSDGQNRHNKTRICATPGGEGGEMLRLLRLENETPTDEVGWWAGRGAPIQQICTPEILSYNDQGGFLAVRLPGTTLLFRPRYRATPVPPAGAYLGCTAPPSRVDANLVLEIAPRSWQGQQHSDVTFNPWDQRCLAIVDQTGNWTVLKLNREDTKSQAYNFKVACRGSLDGDGIDEKSEIPFVACQDGWARCLWVADKTTILICTRRQFQLFSLSHGKKLPFPTFLSREQWFFDVRRCPGHAEWLFVLTSTQVFWIEILPESHRLGDATEKAAGKILLSAHHFRDSSDLSLQMSIEDDLRGMFSCGNSHEEIDSNKE